MKPAIVTVVAILGLSVFAVSLILLTDHTWARRHPDKARHLDEIHNEADTLNDRNRNHESW